MEDRNYIEEFRMKLKEAGVESASKRIELMEWFMEVMLLNYKEGSDMAASIYKSDDTAAVYKNEITKEK